MDAGAARQQIEGKARRFLLVAEHPEYVQASLARRRGACSRCGACCRLLFDCPLLTPDNLCSGYVPGSELGPCKCPFPIDERDIADVKAAGGRCSYVFDAPRHPLAGHGLGLVRIPEESGPWAFDRCPDLVEIDGRAYLKTGWPMTHHPGVVCQYGEAVDEHSRHLYVLRTGVWVVDHVDRWNPDAGLLESIAHLAYDVPTTGTWIGAGIATLGSLIFYIGLGWLK